MEKAKIGQIAPKDKDYSSEFSNRIFHVQLVYDISMIIMFFEFEKY